MQKKLIALAISGMAGLSGAAFAQSNVTVYGILDGTFDIINSSGATGVARGGADYTRVQSNGSRLGFKGTESLGNGMSAFFQLESNAKFDQGGGLDTARDSFLGLKGDFGTVKLGNFSGPNRDLASKLDVVIHSDGIGDNAALLGKLGGRGSVFDTRYTNSIAYITPNFSGFNATIQYQANEAKSDTPGAKTNQSLAELGLNYDNGPIYIGLTHGKLTEKNEAGTGTFNTGTGEDVTETRLGGMYKFDSASIRALFGHTKADGSLGNLKQNVWGVAGTYNVTANGKLLAQYFRAKDLSGNRTGVTDLSDTGAKFWVLGYEHSLSKRTTLIAHYAYLKNDERVSTVSSNGKGYDFGDGSTGIAGTAGSVNNGLKLTGLQLGVNHTF
jgi:predicted porin